MYSIHDSHNASKIQMKLTQFIYFFKKDITFQYEYIFSFRFIIAPVVVKAPVYLLHQSYISAPPYVPLSVA